MIRQSLNPKPQNPETQYCVFFWFDMNP
jgi:hypothetical protein